jgi:hypothetical protein
MSIKFLILLFLFVPFLAATQQKTTGINQLNIPPFVRKGDQPSLAFQLFNKSKNDWTGTIHLQLIDTTKKNPVDGWFFNQQGNQYFTVKPTKMEWIEFPIHIPFEFSKPAAWQLRIKSESDTLYKTGFLRIEPWEYAAEAATPYSTPDATVITKKLVRLSTKNSKTQREQLADNATIFTGDTLLVEIEMPASKSPKIILREQWPAGTYPAMARTLSTHTGAGKVLQLTDKELNMEWISNNPSPLKISYQVVACYPGRFQVPPVLVSSSDSTQPPIRSSYSSLIIEQRKYP